MPLLSHISSLLPLSKNLEQEIKAMAKSLPVAKGKHLLNKDERCTSLYFIERGLLRGYYFDEDKEITHWFAQEGEFATGFYSFISKEPSFEYVQARKIAASLRSLTRPYKTSIQNSPKPSAWAALLPRTII